MGGWFVLRIDLRGGGSIPQILDEQPEGSFQAVNAGVLLDYHLVELLDRIFLKSNFGFQLFESCIVVCHGRSPGCGCEVMTIRCLDDPRHPDTLQRLPAWSRCMIVTIFW